MTTLTYVYADQTAVVGPLATFAEPHAYDLCEAHAARLSAPRGWEVLRLAHDVDATPSGDDLLALADAVREAARPVPVPAERIPSAFPGSGRAAGTEQADLSGPGRSVSSVAARAASRRHLRVLRADD